MYCLFLHDQIHKCLKCILKVTLFWYSPIPNRLTVTNLKQKHVETVVQEWPYSGIFSDCKEWVSDMINQTPSVCIENEQRDPVAWILQQDYGCTEFRRAKLGSAVTMLPCF